MPKLKSPHANTDEEPEVVDKIEPEKLNPISPGPDGVNEEKSLRRDLESPTTEVPTESDKSSNQSENSAKLLSIEDTLEAELEAELQAEIAAEMENKDKVRANEENDTCPAISLDEDPNVESFNEEKSKEDATRLDEKSTGLEEKELSNSKTEPANLVISVIKTEKEDDISESFHIKEELSIKSEEMSLDCDDLALKNETEIKPLILKSESLIKSELLPVKNEESTFKHEPFSVKSEESPIKKESLFGEGDLNTLKSESQNALPNSSVTLDPGDKSVTAFETAETTVKEGEATGVTDCQESRDVGKVHSVSSKQAESEVHKEGAGETAEGQDQTTESESCDNESQIPISGQQLEAQNINCHDEESRSDENEHPVTTDEEIAKTKNLDSNSASLSAPNSPFSDNSECPVSDFHVESDDVSDNGDGILNENDSDTVCENDPITTDDVDSNENSGSDGLKMPIAKKASSSHPPDTNLCELSNFCDSTVLDASCTDNMASQDSSNENSATKGTIFALPFYFV